MALEELSFESVNGQTDARTVDGQKVITIAHPDQSSGELKMKLKQESHRPRLAHLSDTATTDMQMLCNISPILKLQLMKRS